MKTFSWPDQLAQGKAGADAVALWLTRLGCTVEDVQDDPDYQNCDVDFIVNGYEVEVKTEYVARSNLFLEWDGLHKSTARWWFFYVPSKRVIFRFEREALIDWLDAHGDQIGWRTITTSHNGRTWSARGVPVPMRRLYREVPGTKLYHLDEEKIA